MILEGLKSNAFALLEARYPGLTPHCLTKQCKFLDNKVLESL